MARKQSITKEMIQKSALELASREGLEAVTARRVAAAANCSTQPIFRAYENMEQLQKDVIHLAGVFFSEYYESSPRTNPVPFVDLGLTYIRFAKEHEQLFTILFASHYKKEISTYEFINGGDKGYVLKELRRIDGVPAQKAGAIFSNMWTFINGLACMVLNGDYDLTEEEAIENMTEIYEALKKA